MTGRWLALFVTARLGATALAVLLLLVHTVTDYDLVLAWVGGAYGAASAAAAGWSRLQRAPLAWAVDVTITLGLVAASGEWRSPFYLMAVSSLVLPATALRLRPAAGLGTAFTLAYLGVAVGTGVDFEELRNTTRLETFATHLLLPLLATLGLAYAAALLSERERTARLSVEAERRRIAWELHDSAKQRVHAAHLVLSSLARRLGDEPAIHQAMGELRAATADMETSLRELRTPLEGQGLQEAVRRRAAELTAAGGIQIEVRGTTPDLPAFIAAHAFRVVGEAMTNAIRHADAGHVLVDLEGDDRHLRLVVADDGRGPRPASARSARATLDGGAGRDARRHARGRPRRGRPRHGHRARCASHRAGGVIRVLLVDDHPALRAGLHTVLRAEPGLVPVGAVATARDALAELDRARPDVVLVDYHLPDESGLLLCRRIKAAGEPPRVLIYSAYADATLTIPAIAAGADGIASKSAEADELFEAIRLVARGRAVMPPVPRELLDAATSRLTPAELPVFGLLMDRTPSAEIRIALGIDESALVEHTRSIIQKLRPETPAH